MILPYMSFSYYHIIRLAVRINIILDIINQYCYQNWIKGPLPAVRNCYRNGISNAYGFFTLMMITIILVNGI
uniref:Uncharacterized protein n=1 Tax=Rhizophora mucronata TaxID=61149 RepID=A0A2P2LV61_RHIMU